LIIVLPDMPMELRQDALLHLRNAFQHDVLQQTDSAEAGEKFKYPTLHFGWYNRCAKQGKDVPGDVDPAGHRRKGKTRSSKTAQCQPFTTEELQENAKAYTILSECFKKMFEWLAAAVQLFLPAEYEILAQYAEVLPADAHCPAYPFSNFVINFNVTTTVH
ncbi:hypothetical protein HYPSUDRAFT_103625, partial [Hypholoma sublateritium FD-334 SS-4]